MIRVLDDNTINKIAAGEVVERPAAVIRELVENAIDAKSTQLFIELENGGKNLIRIRDNGTGMSHKDAKLSLQRHATSKIRSEADLFTVTSLGFRGEAIPSIASVSRFELLTRQQDDAVGTKIMVNGGQANEPEAAGCPVGTQITVRNLFFNVPARKKFLRTDSTELSHCLEAIVREMLIRPVIDVEVRHNRSVVIRASKSDKMEERAAQLLGNVGRSLVPISFEQGQVKVTGLISPVGVHRATSQNNTYLYVNGRYVKDTAIRRALREAYQGLVPKGRYPTIILTITIPPNEVDVNVHPAKTEVRFRYIRELSEALIHGVRKALQSHGIKKEQVVKPKVSAIPNTFQESLSFQKPSPTPPSPRLALWGSDSTTTHKYQKPEAEQQSLPATVKDNRLNPPKLALPGLIATPKRTFPASVDGFHDGEVIRGNAEALQQPKSTPDDKWAELWPSNEEESTTVGDLLPVKSFADLRVIGQLGLTYILCEGDGELVIIDQHAAHERITLYDLMRNADSQLGQGQRLLAPIVIELTPQRLHALLPNLSVLSQYGLELEQFGGNSLVIRQVPEALLKVDFQKLIEDVADDVAVGGRGTPIHEKIQLLLATRACHNSIRAGDTLSPFRMRELLEELDEVDFGVCAHGRPVAIRVPPNELEKRFHRS